MPPQGQGSTPWGIRRILSAVLSAVAFVFSIYSKLDTVAGMPSFPEEIADWGPVGQSLMNVLSERAWDLLSWLIIVVVPSFWGWLIWPDVKRRWAVREAPAPPPVLPSAVMPPRPSSAPAGTAEIPRSPEDRPAAHRVFSGVTPEFLANLYLDHTIARAQSLAAGHVGTWISVEGTIAQVLPLGDSQSIAFLEGRPSGAGASRLVMVTLGFRDSWSRRANDLALGSPVRVQGQVTGVKVSGVTLDNCELFERR